MGETDGVHYAPVPLGPRYPLGLLVVQNGDAPEPADTAPVNGYEFDGATQFKYVSLLDTLKALTARTSVASEPGERSGASGPPRASQ